MRAPPQPGTVPSLTLPNQSFAALAAEAPPDAPPPTAEERARDEISRKEERAKEVDAVQARVAATRSRALQSASNMLTPRTPRAPTTPREIANARGGNVSALISDSSDEEDVAGG